MKKAALIFLCLVLPSLVGAQTTRELPFVRLVFFDNPKEITIYDGVQAKVTATPEIKLYPSFNLKTGKSSAELQLVPNGSVIRLAPDSDFTILSLTGYERAQSHNFFLYTGKLRMVANRLVGMSSFYTVETPSGSVGVHGTDFTLMHEEKDRPKGTGQDWLFVTEGQVSYASKAQGKTILVFTGEFAENKAPFVTAPASKGWIANHVDLTAFVKAPLPTGQPVP